MYKAFQASNHCLHLPFLPTPPTFHAVASHSLLVPRNLMPFTAPTAANKPRSSAYQLLSPTSLSGWTRIQAGEFFAYKSVLQVTSSNLRILHTCYVAASNFVHSSSIRSTTLHFIQSGRFGHSWTPPSSVTTHSHA